MKLQLFINNILNIIFPKRVDVLEIEMMDASEMLECLPRAINMREHWIKSVFLYKSKEIRRAVWEIKYNRNKVLLEKMGMILYDLILEEVSDNMCFGDFGKPLLVPVPASLDRMKKYGFNQCDLIVKEILKNDNGKNFVNGCGVLNKIKETEHQVKVASRKERLKNISNTFSSDGKVNGRFVIVIDDVVTTGATMNEARRALISAGAKDVICFSLAH